MGSSRVKNSKMIFEFVKFTKLEKNKKQKLEKNRNCEVHDELHETSRTRNFKYNYNIKIKTNLCK